LWVAVPFLPPEEVGGVALWRSRRDGRLGRPPGKRRSEAGERKFGWPLGGVDHGGVRVWETDKTVRPLPVLLTYYDRIF
jgi:hypothetical protein